MTNGLSNSYHLDEPSFKASGLIFYLDFIFDKILISKQFSPRRDAAFGGISSGPILFASVPKSRTSALFDLISIIHNDLKDKHFNSNRQCSFRQL